jgi:hypothetical protein
MNMGGRLEFLAAARCLRLILGMVQTVGRRLVVISKALWSGSSSASIQARTHLVLQSRQLGPRSSSRLDHSRERELEIVSRWHPRIIAHLNAETGVRCAPGSGEPEPRLVAP